MTSLEYLLVPTVSIVLTSYNYSRYIEDTIKSLLDQTYSDYEIIIVDDASNDDSQQIILKYAQRDKRIRYLFHETNQGLSKSTNDGLSLCRGKYIAFIDSDDCWKQNKLEKQMNVFSQDEHVDVVYSDAELMDENGLATGSFFSEKYPAPTIFYIINKSMMELFHLVVPKMEANRSGRIFKDLIISNWICKSSVILRATSVSYKFRQELRLLNDWIFWLDLGNCNFFYMPERLARYRIQQKSLTAMTDFSIWAEDQIRANKFRRSYYHKLYFTSRLRVILFYILLNGASFFIKLCRNNLKNPIFTIIAVDLKSNVH